MHALVLGLAWINAAMKMIRSAVFYVKNNANKIRRWSGVYVRVWFFSFGIYRESIFLIGLYVFLGI